VDEYLGNNAKRQDEWSDSTAVGSERFVEKMKELLGFRARGRNVMEQGEGYHLREGAAPYSNVFKAEKNDIGIENAHFWDKTHD